MAGVREENRLRIALLLLGLGAALVVVGVAAGVQHYRALRDREADQPTVARAETPAVHLNRSAQATLIKRILYILLVLVSIFAVSVLAFKMWSRRFRKFLLHKPAPPTPDADVWAMHRLPEDALADFEEPPPGAEPDKSP